MKQNRFETLQIHVGQEMPDPATDARAVPTVSYTHLDVYKRQMEFGAFVELAPNKDGMVHISKLSDKRVAKVEDLSLIHI